MGDTYIHSIDAYTLFFAGILIKNGGGDGGFVEVEFPQTFDGKSGVHGDVVTYKMGDRITTCRVTLLQQSTYNDSMAEVYQADMNSPSGAGIGTFMLDDLNSGLEISADAARVVQPPTINIQAEAQEVVWTLQLYQAVLAFRSRGSSIQFGFDLDLSASIGFSF
jgi:hypothetical protein